MIYLSPADQSSRLSSDKMAAIGRLSVSAFRSVAPRAPAARVSASAPVTLRNAFFQSGPAVALGFRVALGTRPRLPFVGGARTACQALELAR